MRLILILPLSIFISCNPSLNKEKHSFDSIEVTHSSTWNGCTSVRVDSTGSIVKCNKVDQYKTDSMLCFKGHISKVQLDSIDQQIKLLQLAADSILIESNCKDCSEGAILINENGIIRKIRFLYDESAPDEFIILSDYLLKLEVQDKILCPSVEFETKKWLIVPHPENFKPIQFTVPDKLE